MKKEKASKRPIGHGEKFSRKKEQAMASLLSATTLTEAGKQVGVSEKTLRRWLKDPGFSRELDEAREHLFRHTLYELAQAACNAVKQLTQVMENPYDKKRVKASDVVLARTGMMFEIAKKYMKKEFGYEPPVGETPEPAGHQPKDQPPLCQDVAVQRIASGRVHSSPRAHTVPSPFSERRTSGEPTEGTQPPLKPSTEENGLAVRPMERRNKPDGQATLSYATEPERRTNSAGNEGGPAVERGEVPQLRE
jgi:hypothetical protein